MSYSPSIKMRIARLEKMIFVEFPFPLVCWEGPDEYAFFCRGHPLNGQTICEAQLREIKKEFDKVVIQDFNPDSGRARLETVGQAMERLGADWVEKWQREQKLGVRHVLRTPEGLSIYDFGANAKYGRFWPAGGEIGTLALDIVQALKEAHDH